MAFFCFSSSWWIVLQFLLLNINTSTSWVTDAPMNKGEGRKGEECLLFLSPSKRDLDAWQGCQRAWHCHVYYPKPRWGHYGIKEQEFSTQWLKAVNQCIVFLDTPPLPPCLSFTGRRMEWDAGDWASLAFKSLMRCRFQNQAQAGMLPKYHGIAYAMCQNLRFWESNQSLFNVVTKAPQPWKDRFSHSNKLYRVTC